MPDAVGFSVPNAALNSAAAFGSCPAAFGLRYAEADHVPLNAPRTSPRGEADPVCSVIRLNAGDGSIFSSVSAAASLLATSAPAPKDASSLIKNFWLYPCKTFIF